ncbi:amidohydrolase family protein [Membranihabitans marinus]|uniref:amidohydrolase family protein n=1 Tax=Membranihabitans marinus TaxID=1227546 RepID=UPI001F1C485F|nr:amidohydrolase family protein [Membranihabitans marinus]
MKNIVLLSLLLISIQSGYTQSDTSKWNVNKPPLNLTTHTYTWTEGTWMDIDISPDGSTIVFDILGDIYTLPISGGKATPIREGFSWDIQPKYSPDGKTILFTSDAGGGDNIWMMDSDGKNPHMVTKESFRLLNNGEWMPDGNYFVARKHFTSGRSLGAGEMWLYHKEGGKGIGLTTRKNDQQDVNEPSVSRDGKYLYYSEDVYPGGSFQYNKDVNKTIYCIKQYSFEEGESKTLISLSGGASRPQISPDGKYLAFIRRVDNKTVLYKYHIESGQMYPIYDDLSKDQQEAWAIFGTYPSYDWTPDGKHIVIWAKGKLFKIDVNTYRASEIPFEVHAEKQIAETLQFKNNAFDTEFTAKVIRHAITTPDESTLIFSALGKLWSKKLPNGRPQILLDTEAFLFEPAISNDGKTLAFVSWDDKEKGKLWTMSYPNGQPKAITKAKGIYRTPKFSNDGKNIVFKKESGNIHQGYTYTQNPGVYLIDTDGGEVKLITENGDFPMFSADDKYIYVQQGGYLFGSTTKSLYRVSVDGGQTEEILTSKYAQRIVPSPDGRWVAWSELYKVYVAALPPNHQRIDVDKPSIAFPMAQVARDAGINIHWSVNSDKLFWMLGDQYFSDSLTERFKFLNQQVDSLPPMDSVGISVDLEVKSDQPNGILVLRNARIITMTQDSVIENGTIVIENNIIKNVGRSGKVSIPANAHIIDCKGKTIMPGMVDVHGHLGDFRYGLSPQKNWYYWANLAYGVTTAHDPSSNSEMIFSHSEMIKAGEMVGPRLFSTGTILYGADGDFKAVINDIEDARSAIRRTKAYGAFSVKSYNQPRRDQRQQVIKAAAEENILVMPEGGSTFHHNLNQVADGHTGIEHNIPIAPLYDDVLSFWASSKAANTPTLIVSYGSLSGENYYYQKYDVWENHKLKQFTPNFVIDSRSKHRTMAPDEEYDNGHILVARTLSEMQKRGIKVNLGAHGQLQGLGAHWELWMLASGGMSNMNALRSATINGAEYLGMSHQIGSIEANKLADLLILNSNPLEDLHNSRDLEYTIINGRVFKSENMEEVWPRKNPSPSFYFQEEGSGYTGTQTMDEIHSSMHQCGCGMH